MKVLTVYAHPNPISFSHALLEEFTRGVAGAGHESDVLDLYALKFDPVFTEADLATWLYPGMLPDILETLNPHQRVLDGARGPIQRFLARRLVRGKDNREIAQFLRDHGRKNAARHWQHVANADALAFIAPVFWLSFPAILKGWHERVFSYGNAFALDRSGWEGHVSSRIGLLKHRRALLMMPTIFSREDYDADWVAPMRRALCDWSLQYPGVERVDTVYLSGRGRGRGHDQGLSRAGLPARAGVRARAGARTVERTVACVRRMVPRRRAWRKAEADHVGCRIPDRAGRGVTQGGACPTRCGWGTARRP